MTIYKDETLIYEADGYALISHRDYDVLVDENGGFKAAMLRTEYNSDSGFRCGAGVYVSCPTPERWPTHYRGHLDDFLEERGLQLIDYGGERAPTFPQSGQGYYTIRRGDTNLINFHGGSEGAFISVANERENRHYGYDNVVNAISEMRVSLNIDAPAWADKKTSYHGDGVVVEVELLSDRDQRLFGQASAASGSRRPNWIPSLIEASGSARHRF